MWYRNSDVVEWSAVFSILFSLAAIYLGTFLLPAFDNSLATLSGDLRAVIYAPAAAIAVAAANYARRNITRQLPSDREHTLPGALIIILLPIGFAVCALVLMGTSLLGWDFDLAAAFLGLTTLFSGFYVPVAIQSLSPPEDKPEAGDAGELDPVGAE